MTGRSRNHLPKILDCPVKPGNDTGTIDLIEHAEPSARPSDIHPGVIAGFETAIYFDARRRAWIDLHRARC